MAFLAPHERLSSATVEYLDTNRSSLGGSMINWTSALRETAARCALSASLLSAVLSLSPAALAQNAPQARPHASITRTADSPSAIREDLSRNLFRTETHQVEYQEQVPYQDTETYDVQVPYQDVETYTEDVPYTVQEPYTTTETVYERENVCRDVQRTERECHNEPVCHTEPGSDRQCSVEKICRTDRSGRQVCIDKEVCRTVGTGRRVCNDNLVCREVPRSERVCETVNVPRTRTVTRYRDVTRYRTETRTRTVTRSRTETRTRTVTRYRTETRCCRPETVQVFDRQLHVSVQLNFPAEAQLLPGERETIQLSFDGTEQAPDVAVNIQSTIFKYELINRKSTPGAFSADLRVVPMFTPGELGEQTIQNLKLLPASNATGQQVVFVDSGTRPRVETRYRLTVSEALSGRVVHQADLVANGKQSVAIDIPAAISKTLDYVLRLDVARSGVNLTAPVQFTHEARHDFRRYTPEEVGRGTISKVTVTDRETSFAATFQDMGTNENIETIYHLSVVNLKTEQTVHTADLNALDVTSAHNQVTIEFPKNVVAGDADHKVVIAVERTGIVLTAPVSFSAEGYLDAPDSVGAFKDPNRVVPRTLRGQGEMVALLLQDNTNNTDAVKTRYDVELKVPNGKSLGRALLTREGMQTAGQPEMYMPLRVISVSRSELNKYAAPGKQLQVVIRVVRDGEKIGHVEFTRTATLTVPED